MDLHNLSGEQQILGMVMGDPDQLYRIDRLRSEHFGDTRHRAVYSTIEKLIEKGKNPSVILVEGELKQEGILDHLGGTGWLNDLVLHRTISQFDMEDLAANIIQFYTKRQLRDHGAMLIDMIEAAHEAESILEYAQKKIVSISDNAVENKPITYFQCLGAALEEALQRDGNEELPGVTSGFDDLDDLTNGFKRGDLVVLAAGTGIGKSAFALHLATKSAKAGAPAAIFSCEMTDKQWGKRGLAAACGIPHQRIERGPMSPEEALKAREYLKEFEALPLQFCMTAGYSIAQITSLARKLKIQNGLQFLVIDYLQLLSSSRHFENRTLEVAEITRTLKQLALQMDIPIIALSQLNRNNQYRQDKRPMLADLRESGSIEQDSDIVLFLHRDEKDLTKRGEIEVIVGKNRGGSVGTVELLFDLPTQRFSSKGGSSMLAQPTKSRYSSSDVRW